MSQLVDDFNWDLVEGKSFANKYSKAEREELEKLYEGTLSDVVENDVVVGIISISDVVKAIIEMQKETIAHLNSYITQ